jgi:XRE family transcriptional regulator, fatty acid utilization regulator
VPFFFIRVDQAGNVSKRLDGAGFPFAAHGGGCPLWSVHSVFRTPGQIVTQWLELPDGQRFFSIARTVGRAADVMIGRASIGRLPWRAQPNMRRALSMQRAPIPKRFEATPIGVTCRLCHRTNAPRAPNRRSDARSCPTTIAGG